MFSLNKVMTTQEAECFRALRRWQRAYLKQKLVRAIFPRPAFLRSFVKAKLAGKVLIMCLALVLSPILIVLWLLNILRMFLCFPFLFLFSFMKPRNLRAPGERNIKGVHYQFARHINLPPALYIRCVDDWVRILYGHEKLPKYSLASYLDADYLLRRQVAYEDDASVQNLLKTQISNAREDLSRDLGHY